MNQRQATSDKGQGNRPAWTILSCCLLLVACCFITGCIRRNLTIRSEPPGATLYVNDKLLGTTPHSYDFSWYGWHRVTLKKEGFEQLDARAQLKSPWYFWIPFDLAMELLPVPVHDDHELSYQLQPKQELPMPKPPVTLGASEKTPPTEESR